VVAGINVIGVEQGVIVVIEVQVGVAGVGKGSWQFVEEFAGE
jgi:hypothetical protein